jgi:viroplasmin and RNaseH domain-containing protein
MLPDTHRIKRETVRAVTRGYPNNEHKSFVIWEDAYAYWRDHCDRKHFHGYAVNPPNDSVSFTGTMKSHADEVLEPVSPLVETDNLLRNKGKAKAEGNKQEGSLLIFAIHGGTEDLVYSNQ